MGFFTVHKENSGIQSKKGCQKSAMDVQAIQSDLLNSKIAMV